jgi:hypothetical protein
MRTTVTLDADLHRLLKEAEQRSGKPFKQVLNDAVRAGLTRRPAKVPPFKQFAEPLGLPKVDLTKANALAGQLEDQDIMAKMARGR